MNKPRPQISVPRKIPVVQKQSPMVKRGSPQQLPNDNVDNANPPSIANQPTSNGPVPARHFEPNPLLEAPNLIKFHRKLLANNLFKGQKTQLPNKIHLTLRRKSLSLKTLSNQSLKDQR